MIRAAVLVLALLFSIPANAGLMTIAGPAEQGGLLQGKTAPGSHVWKDGRTIRVAPDGRFLVGLAYDAKPETEIKVKAPDGDTETTTLAVKQRKFETQRINGLPPKEVTPDAETLKRIVAERADVLGMQEAVTKTPLFTHPFRWPVTGIITGLYGSARILNGQRRSPHLGVDIAAPEGTPIYAPTDGVVVLIGDQFFTGNTVMIDHGLGLTSIYAHLEEVDVTLGEHVTHKTRIGLMGATGRATGPNLHWGVHLNGTAVDPELLAGPMPAAPSKDTAQTGHGAGNE